jgi:DNA repair protein RecO (recombination protein O)
VSAGYNDQLTPCYVLHRRDFANTSLLVELFGRDGGRFPVVAKGAKRPRNPAAALLQPFRPLLVALSGRGEVRNLTRVEPAGPPLPLAGAALYCGFYLNELIVRLLGRADPHEILYAHYERALGALAVQPEPSPVLRRFELRLLEQAGYAMVLDHEPGSDLPLRSEARYRYEPERGPVPCADDEGGFSVSGATLLALAADGPLSPQQGREARELMRRVLGFYLGERPLKSRELFRVLRGG